jgi:hypothetical protein
MRKSYAFSLISSVLALSVGSFQLGLKPISQINKRLALLSSTDSNNIVGVNGANGVETTSSDVNSLISLSDSPTSAAVDTTTNLSNPAVANMTSESETLDIPQQEVQIADTPIETIESGEVPQAPAAVVTKDLKLAALGPAYPDDTSYMMCSGCKAGDRWLHFTLQHRGVNTIPYIPHLTIDFYPRVFVLFLPLSRSNF